VGSDRQQAVGEMTVTLRPASIGDEQPVLDWRNEPSIVALSSSQRVVTIDAHRTWFRRILQSPDNLLYIIVANGEDVGVLRMDRVGSDADVAIYLRPGREGRGIGSQALSLGLRLAEGWCSRLIATVRTDNAPSNKFFSVHGFALREQTSNANIYVRSTGGQ
jgi:RimJ/RimL family protein N-acetyltransferase